MSLDCEREPEYPREHSSPQGEQKSPSQPLDTRTVASVLIREFALQSTDNKTLYIILTCELWSMVTRFSATSPTHRGCTTFFTHQVACLCKRLSLHFPLFSCLFFTICSAAVQLKLTPGDWLAVRSKTQSVHSRVTMSETAQWGSCHWCHWF